MHGAAARRGGHRMCSLNCDSVLLADSMPYGTESGGTSMCRTGSSANQSFPSARTVYSHLAFECDQEASEERNWIKD